MFDSKEWVRQYINDECIWRTNRDEPTLPGKKPGTEYGWQFYLRRALFDSNCSFLIAELFWERYHTQAGTFQLAACESAGVPLACAIQSYAKFKFKKSVPVFSVKKEPKKYGLHNLTEGIIMPEMPTMIVDDLAGSQETFMRTNYLLESAGVNVHDDYFAVVNKVGNGVTPHQVYLQNKNLYALFTCDDFDLSPNQYGNSTTWHGLTVRAKDATSI